MGEEHKSTMRASILTDAGQSEFKVTGVSMDVNGEVHVIGDDADGRPFSITIGGRSGSGKTLLQQLRSMAAVMGMEE